MYADKKRFITKSRVIKELLCHIFREEGKSVLKIHYIFCSDKYLYRINANFLNHHYFTDVITFDLRDKKIEAVNGEIYISIDRVKHNAKVYSVPWKNELLRVIIHGALHLCGYADSTLRSRKRMHQKEDKYLAYYISFIKVSRETS